MARALKGHRGLFCTSRDPAAVAAAFTDFEREDYARSGSAASETVKLEGGGTVTKVAKVIQSLQQNYVHDFFPVRYLCWSV